MALPLEVVSSGSFHEYFGWGQAYLSSSGHAVGFNFLPRSYFGDPQVDYPNDVGWAYPLETMANMGMDKGTVRVGGDDIPIGGIPTAPPPGGIAGILPLSYNGGLTGGTTRSRWMAMSPTPTMEIPFLIGEGDLLQYDPILPEGWLYWEESSMRYSSVGNRMVAVVPSIVVVPEAILSWENLLVYIDMGSGVGTFVDSGLYGNAMHPGSTAFALRFHGFKYDVTPDGAVWYTLLGTNQLKRATPGGSTSVIADDVQTDSNVVALPNNAVLYRNLSGETIEIRPSGSTQTNSFIGASALVSLSPSWQVTHDSTYETLLGGIYSHPTIWHWSNSPPTWPLIDPNYVVVRPLAPGTSAIPVLRRRQRDDFGD